MDDENSRDKLVRRYVQLYDEADICSQQLEELSPLDVRDSIEQDGTVFFQEVLTVGACSQIGCICTCPEVYCFVFVLFFE